MLILRQKLSIRANKQVKTRAEAQRILRCQILLQITEKSKLARRREGDEQIEKSSKNEQSSSYDHT